MKKNLPQQIGEEKIVFTGKLHAIMERQIDENGTIHPYERAIRPPGVRLIIQQDTKILLSREYRLEQKSWDYRLPGGKVFDTIEEYLAIREDKQKLLAAARAAAVREAIEEVGVIVQLHDLKLAHISHCGATIEWDLYYFRVSQFTITHANQQGSGEHISAEFYTENQIS